MRKTTLWRKELETARGGLFRCQSVLSITEKKNDTHKKQNKRRAMRKRSDRGIKGIVKQYKIAGTERRTGWN